MNTEQITTNLTKENKVTTKESKSQFIALLAGNPRVWFKEYSEKANAFNITVEKDDVKTSYSWILPKAFLKKSKKGEFYVSTPKDFKIKVSKYNHTSKESSSMELSAYKLYELIKELRVPVIGTLDASLIEELPF